MRIHFILEPDSADRFLELGRLAESLGFEAMWTANHLSARDPFLSFSALARESTSIRMGPVAISPFELHPLKMANQLFALNEMCQGRAQIVVGGGGGTSIAMHLKSGRYVMHQNMVSAVKECVEFLKGVSSSTPLTFSGETFQVDNYFPTWASDEPPLIYVAATRPKMLRMATNMADGIMFSDLTLGRLEETMKIVNEGLTDNNRDKPSFRLNNLFSWHVKENLAEAKAEARRKLWVRGMLMDWYISPALDPDECQLVADHMPAFIKAYTTNSPEIDGVPDSLVDKLLDELTFTGDFNSVDALIEKFHRFKDAGINEMGIRLYDDPAASIRLISETIGPELR
ncbi:MAG: LLM class flavin-dependent oxidoreductase [Gammaproteobacteria bacterium]|nr:LLM class flavin-dependent oxidoreductase [Gammaproteobacteria bacterium]